MLNPLAQEILRYEDAEMQARGHFIKGLTFNYSAQAEQAAQAFKKALSYIDKSQDYDERFTYPMVLRNLGIAQYRSRQFAAGDSSFQELKSYAEEKQDSISLALALKSMSTAQVSRSNFDSAVVLMRDAILIYEELDYRGMPLAYLTMGSIFGRMGQSEEALSWFRRALHRIDDVPDRRMEGRILNNMAVAKREQGQLDSAQYFLKEALFIQEELGSIYDQVEIKGNLARNYIELQEYDLAKANLDEALAAVNPNNPRASRILQNIWILQLDWALAVKDAEEVLKWRENMQAKIGWKMIRKDWPLLERMARSHEFLGDKDSALFYFKAAEELEDKAKAEQDAATIKSVANDIELVGLKKERQALKQWYQSVFLYTIVGSGLLFLVLVIYNRFKRKNLSSQLEEANHAIQFKVEDRSGLAPVEVKAAEEKQRIKLKSKAVVPVADILYVQSEGHYLNVFIQGKDKPEIDRGTLKAMQEELKQANFQRIHRSYLVNCDQLKAVYATKVLLNDGTELPVSRTFKDELKARFSDKTKD